MKKANDEERRNKKRATKQQTKTNLLSFLTSKKTILVTLLVLIAIVCVVLNLETIKKTNIVQDIIARMTNEETISSRAGGITNIDLTGLVTGDDVNHTHIYERKYDNDYHWEECFICGNEINREAHNKETTGTGVCATSMIERCSDGCGYSVSTYIDHHIVYYDNVYDESGTYTNTGVYYHRIGVCDKCGNTSCDDRNGNSTIEYCRDSEGRHISCSNRHLAISSDKC